MDYSKNKYVVKETRFSSFLSVVMGFVFTAMLTSCEFSKDDVQKLIGSISGKQIPDSVALPVINQQNTDRYELLKETVLAMSELSGPIRQLEGGNLTLSEEVKIRVKMIKDRITQLEKMANDPADKALVLGLKAQLDGMKTKVKYLEKTVAFQENELRKKDEDIKQKAEELQAAYDRLQSELMEKERLNGALLREKGRLANILYQVAQDYVNLGNAVEQASSSKTRRYLRSVCIKNAEIRFHDAENAGFEYSHPEMQEVCSMEY